MGIEAIAWVLINTKDGTHLPSIYLPIDIPYSSISDDDLTNGYFSMENHPDAIKQVENYISSLFTDRKERGLMFSLSPHGYFPDIDWQDEEEITLNIK